MVFIVLIYLHLHEPLLDEVIVELEVALLLCHLDNALADEVEVVWYIVLLDYDLILEEELHFGGLHELLDQ